MTDRRGALTIAAGAALVPLVIGTPALAAGNAAGVLISGRDQPFDSDWRFLRGPGEGLERADLDDSAWRTIDLPHDWSIEDVPGGAAPAQLGPFDKQLGPFDKTSIGGTATGFSVGGEGWYRKHFRGDTFPADTRVEIAFDGVYLESDMWLNGHHLGTVVHGYMPFAYDLTPFLDRGGDNVLAVHVRNIGRNSRWYSGSGIYRQVRIDVLPWTARIARGGVAAWTRRIDGGNAAIDVTTGIAGDANDLVLSTRLRDPHGKIVAQARAQASAEVTQQLAVHDAQLWSPDHPYLYTLETQLQRAGKVVDVVRQPYGIRIVTMDPRQGLAINGTAMKLRGGCVHHDNGLLGAVALPDADARRVRLLKARGYNAIRSSHNTTSRSLREACDQLGMLLIEEAFDAWHVAKEPQDFSTEFKQHWPEVIRAMVLGARNSPSVIMWSIGNEIPYRATPEGVEWSWKLANAVKRLDQSRPVTAGLNGVLGRSLIPDAASARPGRAGKVDNASTVFLDVPGYNYRLEDIEAEHHDHPERVVYASETFAKDAYDYWALSERAPYFMGEFVWTAMDYLGEAGIGAALALKNNVPFYFAGWPWVGSWCGDVDLIGDQKPASRYRDVVWGISPLELAVQRPVPDGYYEYASQWGWPDELQSWSWPGAEGRPVAVRIYARADTVSLLLDGKEIGRKTLADADKCRAEFTVSYAPGRLEALAWRGGREIARRKLETVGAPAALRLTAEPRTAPGVQGLQYVRVEVVDAAGKVIPDDERTVTLSVVGPATLAAFGSSNPHATGSLQALAAKTFHGAALAILRSRERGSVRIEARADGLRAASTFVRLG